tara:strand:+ start:1210 stop:1758 length:549 start_codon:yes stop_codon:yes gene_type:complete
LSNLWKEQLQINKPTIGLDIKDIPEDEGGPCWSKLERALQYLESQSEHFQQAIIEWKQVPEEVACKIIEMFSKKSLSSTPDKQFKKVNSLWTYIDYYIDDDFTFDIQVYPGIETEEQYQQKQAYKNHLIHINYRTDWVTGQDGREYNEKIFNIIKKFLNILGTKPYKDFNEAWFKRMGRGVN